MNAERYQELCTEFRQQEQAIIAIKRREYSPSIDVLQNFKEVAAMESRTAPETAGTLLLKHIQGIIQAIRQGKGNRNWVWMTEEGFEGLKQRFADARNYLLLLAACIEEEEST